MAPAPFVRLRGDITLTRDFKEVKCLATDHDLRELAQCVGDSTLQRLWRYSASATARHEADGRDRHGRVCTAVRFADPGGAFGAASPSRSSTAARPRRSQRSSVIWAGRWISGKSGSTLCTASARCRRRSALSPTIRPAPSASISRSPTSSLPSSADEQPRALAGRAAFIPRARRRAGSDDPAAGPNSTAKTQAIHAEGRWANANPYAV